MYDTILLPTDGSSVAERATAAAIRLADWFDASIHAVHVQELGELPPGVEDVDADEFAQAGRTAVSAVGDRAREAGVPVTTTVVDYADTVHGTIVTVAGEVGADCIVMGTHGRTGLDRYVLGSVAEQTLRESPVPVVTVHEATVLGDSIESVLVPTDGSDAAESAVEHAVEFGAATGATLHTIHAVDTGVVWGDVDSGTVLEALEDAGRAALETVRELADRSAVETVQASIANDVAHRAIVDYATDNDIDWIVMGTHGRTGLDRYLLGSVTERVVRLTDVPVTATKPAE